jgi:very-short-patch-repair endonuclease
MRGANERKTERARSHRRVENDAEAALWSDLRGRRLNGYKFVRQLPIGPYFADFACREVNLVIEVDGSQHGGSARDVIRDRSMVENGWSILRVWHADVLKDRARVLETIVAAVEGKLQEPVMTSDLKFIPAKKGRSH